MREAPKKMWIYPDLFEEVSLAKMMDYDVQYIRADLVAGLVEALEDLVSLCEAGLDSDYDIDAEVADAKAVLKALEKE